MIFISKFLVPKGYNGITMFPFIFFNDERLKHDKRLINHEAIHLKQQLELLIIPFYIFYGTEFLIRLLKHRNWQKAYRNISFEREAYANEAQLDYLKQRTFWAFLKYLC